MSRKELTDAEREKVGTQAVIIAQLLVRLGRSYIRAVRADSGQNDPAEQKFTAALTESFMLLAESGQFNNKS